MEHLVGGIANPDIFWTLFAEGLVQGGEGKSTEGRMSNRRAVQSWLCAQEVMGGFGMTNLNSI